jgi:hypothetical protein
MTDDLNQPTRRDDWTNDVLIGRVERIASAFEADRVPAPTLLWAPRADDARTRPIAFLIGKFMAGYGSLVVDPTELRAALGYINILEPVDGGANFRFRLFGSHVAEASDSELTGRLVSDMEASPYVVDFAVASYRAVLMRRLPLLSVRYPAGARLVGFWERLVVPYRCARSGEERLLVGHVPADASGPNLLPRLVY